MCRLIIGGELPNSISSSSLGWPDDAVDAVESNKEMLVALQRQADSHEQNILQLKAAVDDVKEPSTVLFNALSERLGTLGERIEALETQANEMPSPGGTPVSPDPPGTGS